MGLMAAWFAFEGSPSQHWRLFLTTGMLGGFTTFSTFSLDTALLYERGELGLAALYVLVSVAAGDRRAVRRAAVAAASAAQFTLITSRPLSQRPSRAGRACPTKPCRLSRPGFGVVNNFSP